jgi:hypothetical protein
VYTCIQMQKWYLLKPFQEEQWRCEFKYSRIVEGVNSSMIYLILCKNFWKCHTVPPPSTTKIKVKKTNTFLISKA